MTALAAPFIKSSARLSFGLSKLYFFDNLIDFQLPSAIITRRMSLLVKTSAIEPNNYPGIL
jgi:hypothetical protein